MHIFVQAKSISMKLEGRKGNSLISGYVVIGEVLIGLKDPVKRR